MCIRDRSGADKTVTERGHVAFYSFGVHKSRFAQFTPSWPAIPLKIHHSQVLLVNIRLKVMGKRNLAIVTKSKSTKWKLTITD